MYFVYLRRELRRRARQAVLIAIGLAVGIGLVVTVSAASAGVKSAQGEVLHSLYGVGTDITVTKTAAPGSSGAQRFRFGGGANHAEITPGQHISRQTLRPSFGESTLPYSDVAKVSSLAGAAGATGALTLTDTSFSGTIPSFREAGGRFGEPAGATGSEAGRSGPSAAFSVSTFTVDGVAISSSQVGPLTAAEVTKGSYFKASEADSPVAIVSSTYAKQHSLSVGSKLSVAEEKVSVIGVASVPSGAAEVYLPLGTAQKLSGSSGKITTIFLRASSAGDVSSLASKVSRAIPGATVATSESLASEVSGSLQSASKLANSLGKWLSIVALIVAFLLAGLLMVSAVSRRVREFGTLKAIGWRTRRIVGQVMGEGIALGIGGGILGIVLGVVGAEVITAISPSLTATVGPSFANGGAFAAAGPGAFGAAAGRSAGRGAFTHTVLVHMTAPLQGGTIGLAVGLAIAGGLIAGAFGSWRAARLRPAAALRSLA